VLQDKEIIQLLLIILKHIGKNNIYISLNTIKKVRLNSRYMFNFKTKSTPHTL